ncbi:MAG: hypothetical protein GY765_23790 [bacterium]|nr:hypothetical protein [bacterium]
MDALLIWGKFVGLLALIYVFGTRAAKSADIIAEKKGLSKAFMGVVFISMVTSFPELFTGISAVVLVDAPDMAVGEIMGSCLFNMLILALIDMIYKDNNLFRLKGKMNILPIAFSFILINVFTMAIAFTFGWSILNVSIFSIIIFALYMFFMRVIFKERKVEEESYHGPKYAGKSLMKEVFFFIISSIVIIGVGIYLPIVGKELAQLMSWNDSFVGVIFLAFVTSFPELVVSFSTARMGAFDMLMGNITGSNLFNVAILFFIDVFYIKNQLFGSISETNVSIGLIALLMNFIVFFAVVRGAQQKFLKRFSSSALVIVLLYILNLVIVYGT